MQKTTLIKNKKQIKIAFILFSVFFCSNLFSQSTYKRVIYKPDPIVENIGIRTGYGVIIPHRESMVHLITGHVSSFELFAEKSGHKRVWNRYYSYPTNGVIFYTGFLGNNEVLGNAFAIDYYSNIHLIKKHKGDNKSFAKFLFDMRLSTGFGFLTKTFDPDINNHNVAIGSKLNISVGLSFDFKWRIKQDLQFFTGFNLRHFSNGSFTTPNLGINIPTLTVGIKKNIVKHSNFNREYVILDSSQFKNHKLLHQRFHDFIFVGGLGIKEIYPAGGKKYGTYSFEFTYAYHNSHRSALLLGADVIHNVALYQHSILHDSTFTGTEKDITQYTINLGYAQVFDKFELFIQTGFYLISKAKKDGAYYQRLGGRYIFNEKWIVQFALKTHFAKADYFEIGVGYNLRKKIKQLKLENKDL